MVGGQHHAPAALPLGKRPGTHGIGAWVGLDELGKFVPIGIRSPDCSARSESLYRPTFGSQIFGKFVRPSSGFFIYLFVIFFIITLKCGLSF